MRWKPHVCIKCNYSCSPRKLIARRPVSDITEIGLYVYFVISNGQKANRMKAQNVPSPQCKTLRSFQKYFSKAFSRSRWKVSPWNRPQVVPTERIRKRPRPSFLFNNVSPFLLWIKFCEKHNNNSSTCKNRISGSLQRKKRTNSILFGTNKNSYSAVLCSAISSSLLSLALYNLSVWCKKNYS